MEQSGRGGKLRTGGAAAYLLRPVRAGDVEEMARVHCAVWRETYREAMTPQAYAELAPERFVLQWQRWADRLGPDGTTPEGAALRVAEAADGSLHGFVSVGPARDAQAPVARQLWAINLLAEARGTGLADRMMSEVLGPGPAYLWVAEGNERAIRFYRRHGFAPDGATVTEERDGIAEARMVRTR